MAKQIHIIQPGRMSKIYSEEFPGCSHDIEILQVLFGNWSSGSGCESEEFTESRTRSMSVGDFVGIDGRFYKCASFGWDLTARDVMDNFCEAVEKRMRETGEDSWSALSHFKWLHR